MGVLPEGVCQGTRTDVPLTYVRTTMVFVVFNLGILRDYITHKYPLFWELL